MAKMIIRHPMRHHVKIRFPHMIVTRIDEEAVSTDPVLSNCKSKYCGYIAAQIVFDTKLHTIYVYRNKSKVEFLEIYRDFIRNLGAPSALRGDNAKRNKVK